MAAEQLRFNERTGEMELERPAPAPKPRRPRKAKAAPPPSAPAPEPEGTLCPTALTAETMPEVLEAARAALGYLGPRTRRPALAAVALLERFARGEPVYLDEHGRVRAAMRPIMLSMGAGTRVKRGAGEVLMAALGFAALGDIGARRELRGKVLGCWCAPKLCHGDVLARIANEVADG